MRIVREEIVHVEVMERIYPGNFLGNITLDSTIHA